MSLLRDLTTRWREHAEVLRLHGDDAVAAILERHADEVEAALRDLGHDLLSPADAAEYAGVSERTLRQWRADGRVQDYGSPGRPLYRRGELPKAVRESGSAFDARAAAQRLAS